MAHSTLPALLLATPFAQDLLPLTEQLLPQLQQLGQLLQDFRSRPPTPQATRDLEHQLAQQARALARTTLEWLLNRLEPDDLQQAPARLEQDGNRYRLRGKTPATVATLFGKVRLRRLLYEPYEPGEKCVHPLQRQLGLVAGCATPALAERAALLAVGQPQRQALAALQRDHDLHWSCSSYRKVIRELSAGLAEHRQAAQVRRVLGWLRKASEGTGPRRPVLAVGRDGVHTPLRRAGYQEGGCATLTVFDRRGKRLGTVDLGRMPQPGQGTLSGQLTALLRAVLAAWEGPPPRLAYLTDGGWHPSDYYRTVLRRLEDPRRPGQRLVWERIIDFYHAAQYISQLAEALFGDTRQGRAWAKRMRRRLRDERGGVTRVLQSAAYHRNQRELTGQREQAYQKAHRYLQKRGRWMAYHRYRRAGLPLGSGVTEAACKTVFTQRLKQSGMGWGLEGGQVVLDLRVLWLSGVWDEVQQDYWEERSRGMADAHRGSQRDTHKDSQPKDERNAA
jgi:hypothetical protein